MTHITAIAGSLRKASFNLGLANAARDVAPDGVTVTVHTLHGIPLYDGDAEAASGLPEAVVKLKDAILASDAVLLVTPEYNNGIPGVFKNAIDWLSRPSGDIPKIFGNRPFGVIGASPGGFGTILSQNAWLPVLRTLGTHTWFGGRLMVSRAGQAFDADGNLTDQATRDQLAKYLAGFAAFAGLPRQ
ncbi:MAG: NADPH-dependent FMN reductase [Micropepsaceae bacterium]